MDAWPGPITALTLFAEDLAATKAFYLDVFELPVFYEDDVSFVLQLGATLVNVLQQDEAPSLVEPAVVAPSGSGARMQLTLTVDDVDARSVALVAKGVVLVNGPLDRSWGVRTALFADPAGHLWELAQPLT